jgi:hypothetical protein
MKAKAVCLVLGLVTAVLFMSFSTAGSAGEPAQTAQSIMVYMEYDSEAYEIGGTTTWTFQRGTVNSPGCAMNAYTTVVGGPVVSCNGGGTSGCQTAPTPPSAPAANMNELQNWAQHERCTFFCGGELSSNSYTQFEQVNVNSGPAGNKGTWRFTWTYTITPISNPVEANTCWTSVVEGGGTVDIEFAGFACSESFQKLSNRNKYSFTMIDSQVSRVYGVQVELLMWVGPGANDWQTVAGPNPVPETDPLTGQLPVSAATADFQYFANGGAFGKAAVLSALHYADGKAKNYVNNILKGIDDGSNFVDNFAGNDNDLASGQVHIATFTGEWPGLTEAGSYRTRVTGTLKSNAGQADMGFSVTSNTVVIGGCSCSQ